MSTELSVSNMSTELSVSRELQELQVLRNLPDVSFINGLTLEQIQSRLISLFTQRYEQVTGKTLELRAGDPRARFLYAIGVLMEEALEYINMAGRQDLLKYAYGPFLDNQAAFWGLSRLPAAPAETTLEFTLSAVQTSAISIPQGTRVTNGGGLYFATTEYTEIPAGSLTVRVPAVCQTPGTAGNYIEPGALRELVDPLPFVESAVNVDETNGGADIESDDRLRVRVYLAPAGYSTAGPRDAYAYHVLSYSSAIGAAKVSSPEPGEVEIRIIMEDGALPSETLCEEIEEYLSGDTIRPLTDHVTVKPPDVVEYDVNVKFWISRSMSARAAVVQRAVQQAIDEFNVWQCSLIGRDINPSELIRRMMEAGAKRVEVTEPVFTALPAYSIAQLGDVDIVYGEIEDD